MEKGGWEPTRISPEHLVSAYILNQISHGNIRHLDDEECAHVISLFLSLFRENKNSLKFDLTYTTYRGSARGEYSPEVGAEFQFLCDTRRAIEYFPGEFIITRKGIKYAMEKVDELRREDLDAANQLEVMTEQANYDLRQRKTWRKHDIFMSRARKLLFGI
ncbi:MAG: hypothetical protein ABIH49_02215 [archaeon]